ncbi:toxin-antitoxin system, toxin component [Streptomyces sp. NPDC005931]|uniref:toxin-antitoxin system, toxin component n=1 Tax=Streptomyces sp. NPDC005931 TaxID=3364737 RepID=UPI0036BEB642
MSTGAKGMRRLSARLVEHLPRTTGDGDLVPALGHALSRVRGRPVRLHAAAFPPATASGVWIDRGDHDLIVYEENTDPEHQLVIIGHEVWHMFQGHCAGTGHSPTASRGEAARTTAELVAALCARATGTTGALTEPTDAALHFAARADTRRADEELAAERFGFRFATDVRAALEEARAAGDPHHLAGRLQASMAHRFHRG